MGSVHGVIRPPLVGSHRHGHTRLPWRRPWPAQLWWGAWIRWSQAGAPSPTSVWRQCLLRHGDWYQAPCQRKSFMTPYWIAHQVNICTPQKVTVTSVEGRDRSYEKQESSMAHCIAWISNYIPQNILWWVYISIPLVTALLYTSLHFISRPWGLIQYKHAILPEQEFPLWR